MIKYTYSLKEDIRWSYRTIKNRRWLRSKNLRIFYPNPLRMIWLWLRRPKVSYQASDDITCYWIHAGTWGSFIPPDNIYICPWHIDRAGGMERVIHHEITHLKLFEESKNMTHEEREEYINTHEFSDKQ